MAAQGSDINEGNEQGSVGCQPLSLLHNYISLKALKE